MIIRRVAASSLPSDISRIPDIRLCFRWTDSTGDNVIVSTGKSLRPSENPGYLDFSYSKEFVPYVYRFLLKNDSADLVWRTPGSGLSCQVTGKGDNVKSSFIVTDLDKNSVAEIWIIFKAVCADAQGPSPMKIIMYQFNRRYLQNGTRLYKNGEKSTGGTYQFDDAFKQAPSVFKDYADQLWKKNVSD